MAESRPSRAAEVKLGEAAQQRILDRWLALSEYARGYDHIHWSGQYADYDALVCVRSGRILAYLEIKFRRVEFTEFGDAMFPERKVRFAREVCHDRGEYPLIAVTEYACGTLVEVDLRDEPAERRFIKRFDRTKAVPHVFYSKDQLTVLEGPRPARPPKPKPKPKPKPSTPRSPSRRRVHVA